MHIHTVYSDGAGTHQTIADSAIHAGLDFVIVTDHNVWVSGVEGYYGDKSRGHTLLLTGEEIHDRRRLPQVNHCLVYGVNQEMAQWAHEPQALIDHVNRAGGMTFLAHPHDKRLMWHPEEPGIPWVDWDLQHYTGLEIWNYMSVLKDVLKTVWKSLRPLFQPERYIIGPHPETLAKWDELLIAGKRVVGIGNSDAHARRYRIGPLSHVVFPYDYLFHCVNTRIVTATPLAGEVEYDRGIIYRALREGRVFISYDILGSGKGFRFSAQGGFSGSAQMGESIRLGHGVTLQVLAPRRARIKLIFQGKAVLNEANVESVVYVAREAGAYRVEVWREFKGIERCWILSNPIYVEPNLASLSSTD